MLNCRIGCNRELHSHWHPTSCNTWMHILWKVIIGTIARPHSLARISLFQLIHSLAGKEVELLSCVQLCNSMDCSLPGPTVHGIFQARILEWVAISFSRGSSRPRDRTWVSHLAGRHFTLWATRESHTLF